MGDVRAQIEALFHRHAPGVGGYVIARTGDPELAEAITAQVFTLVVRKFEQCQGSHAAWLWAIVRSELARHFRDRKRHERIDGEIAAGLVDGERTPQENLAQAETHEQLHDAMSELDEDEHTIVYMKFFQDLPNAEIAAALRLTTNHVAVKIHRTLKRLRDLLEPRVSDPIKEPTVKT